MSKLEVNFLQTARRKEPHPPEALLLSLGDDGRVDAVLIIAVKTEELYNAVIVSFETRR